MSDAIDMGNAVRLLEEALAIVRDLNGKPHNIEAPNNKDRMRESAARSRDLLYAAHIADLARAEILNQYHSYKGADAPTVIA